MTERSNDTVPSRTHDASNQTSAAAGARQRVVTLPARLRQIPSCEGIPDRFSTYLVNIALLLFFGAMFAGLLVAPFDDASVSRVGFIGFLLWLCMLACVAWAIVIVIRAMMNIGGWFRVDPTGFRFGIGKPTDPAAMQKEQHIEWRDIVSDPTRCCDVDYNMASRVTMSPATFQFGRRGTHHEPAKRFALRTSLVRLDSDDAIRCLRFTNRHELLVALLCGLAHQGLRFDPRTFIAAGIHPETWQPLEKA
ncbi:hypothetical protein [Burkholderia territorii]|uniref:hypothetical protein n=1 Tax=Burkholderia territorii TaxID=1503055 RepID=UPI000A597025|nr:hypothetical protein [Burkholderia territorii]